MRINRVRNKPRILVFVRYYLPGYKSGGQMRTLVNMVLQFGDEFEFRIVTLDRDKHDSRPYEGIQVNTWVKLGRSHVLYIRKGLLAYLRLIRIIRSTEHNVIYLNSFFDSLFSFCPLLARYLRLVPKSPVVCAVRGELSPGALQFKRWKKLLYITALKGFRICRRITWQASSNYEADDIRGHLGMSAAIQVAPDLPTPIWVPLAFPAERDLQINPIRLVFLSRIDRTKNLRYALDVLSITEIPVIFDIYGDVDDKEYWDECLECIRDLPAHIRANYIGPIPHEKVILELAKHDLFFLPTHGENYGHVIYEALASGVPVLISDQTPWRGLQERGVGYDVSLDSPREFAEIIKRQALMPAAERAAMRRRACNYAMDVETSDEVIRSNRELFLTSMRA